MISFPLFLSLFRAAATAKSLQSCLTLCDPINSLLPGSSVPGILQARPLEWVAISFSNAWKWSRSVMSDPQRPHELQPTRLLHPWDFPGKSTGWSAIALSKRILIQANYSLNVFYRLFCKNVIILFWNNSSSKQCSLKTLTWKWKCDMVENLISKDF